MTLRRLLQKLKLVHRGIARDSRGAAAVEFGLITPAILGIFFGTAELAQGVSVDRKLTLTARALSDLVAQSTTISDTDMTNIFAAGSGILTPYSVSPLKAKVTAVNINAAGTSGTVAWSSAYNDTPRAVNEVVMPTDKLKPLWVANTQLIWSEVKYGYTPAFAWYITGTLNLTDQFFARPRQSSTICRPPTVTTCS
jgi:Flp pilus assembly protein TadG